MRTFYEKYKKGLSIVLAWVLLVQIALPISRIYADDGTNLGNIFTDVTLKVDGSEITDASLIEIKDGTQVALDFKWAVPDGTDIESGDWAEIALPDALDFLKDDNGSLLGPDYDGDGNPDVVGTYTLDKATKKLKVVFNGALTGKNEKHGTVGFLVQFDLEEFTENTKQIIKFDKPIDKEFDITLKPGGEVSSISKFGKPDAAINAKNVEWEIDVNTALGNIENAIVTDQIPEGLELVPGSIEVYHLQVGYTGQKTEGAKLDAEDFSVETIATPPGFKVTLGKIDSAYRIKYKTKIIDYDKAPYTNKAELFDGATSILTAESTVNKVEKESIIEKSGVPDTTEGLDATKVTWTIDINKIESAIKNAEVKDVLGSNLKAAKNIKIYKLEKGSTSWTLGADLTADFADTELGNTNPLTFPIKFGDITGAYRIVFETDIDYGAEYAQNVALDNTATLTGDDTDVSDKATVTVKRSPLLEKTGTSTVNYDTKEIKWTIHVNKANHTITDAVITDIFGPGYELKSTTPETAAIKIYDKNGAPVPVDAASGLPKITLTKDGTGKITGFKAELGDINSYYKIEYVTTITDYDHTGDYTNKATLGGGGIGTGVTVEPGKDVTIQNSYAKSTIGTTKAPVTVGTGDSSIQYDGVNYKEQTMSWKLLVKPMKEKITELTITDTFPNNGLVFLPETLRVVRGTGSTAQMLVAGTDYTVTPKTDTTVTPNTTGYQNGFVLTFTGALPLQGADYSVYYKTSFDPDKVLEAEGTLNTKDKYLNEAVFKGKTESNKDIDVKKDASYTIIKDAFNSGKKEGDIRRADREIDWRIYVNYMAQDLTPGDYTVTDTLSAGQVFDASTVVVREYSVAADGTIQPGAVLEEENYTVSDITDTSFTLTFPGGIDKPYLIAYTAKITGISQPNYTNTATAKAGGGSENPYTASVTYTDHDKFLLKEGAAGSTVYTDDVINWSVTLNTSLSEIENAVFTDTIASGLVYVNDSLKVYRMQGADKVLVGSDHYTLGNELLANGDRTLTVTFSNPINAMYIIEYDTVVVATAGNVKNTANFKGDKVESVPTVIKQFTATQASYGTGSGVANKGTIKIVKVDGDDATIKLDAEFELYYFLNDEKRVIEGTKATVNGELEYENLPLRTYYLREVTPPNGYEPLTEPIEFTLTAANKTIEREVKNFKLGSLSILKVDVNDHAKLLEGAEFTLTNTGTNKEYILKTDAKGEASVNGLPHGDYTLKETKAPSGYARDNTVRTITIGTDEGQAITYAYTLTNRRTGGGGGGQDDGSVRIQKVDSRDETQGLAGAVFELRNEAGTVVATLTTNSSGFAQIGKLPFGKYFITETKAPAGYILMADPQAVDITSVEAALELKFINEKSPDNPLTPGNPGTPETPKPEEGIKTPGDGVHGPKTGQSAWYYVWPSVFVVSLFGLALSMMLLARERRRGKQAPNNGN